MRVFTVPRPSAFAAIGIFQFKFIFFLGGSTGCFWDTAEVWVTTSSLAILRGNDHNSVLDKDEPLIGPVLY